MTTSELSDPTLRRDEATDTDTWTYLAIVVAGSVGLLCAILGLNLWAALAADEPLRASRPEAGEIGRAHV